MGRGVERRGEWDQQRSNKTSDHGDGTIRSAKHAGLHRSMKTFWLEHANPCRATLPCATQYLHFQALRNISTSKHYAISPLPSATQRPTTHLRFRPVPHPMPGLLQLLLQPCKLACWVRSIVAMRVIGLLAGLMVATAATLLLLCLCQLVHQHGIARAVILGLAVSKEATADKQA